MPTVYFIAEGGLANNLFQYFAAELMRKMYGYDEVKLTFQINLEFNLVIDDAKWKTICTRYQEGHPVPLDTTRNILMMGFFQRSEPFEADREYLRSLFTIDNLHYINRTVQIKNIVSYQTKHTVVPGPTDLTMHIRCGDFLDQKSLLFPTPSVLSSQLTDPSSLIELIRSIPHTTLYLVHDTLKEDWEKHYVAQFDCLNPVAIHGNMADDFDFLMKSHTLLLSASTFSWMAAFLGNATQVHIPYHSHYGGIEGTGQSLAGFHEGCKVYYSMDTWPTSQGMPANPAPSAAEEKETA